jgi:hypothetical protein
MTRADDREGPAGPDPSGPADTVRGFLLEVRSGEHPERAGRYLAPAVRAHQGRPGRARAVVTRSPAQYAEHVRDMRRAVGPWTFEVLGVTAHGDDVEAAWRQDGRVREGPDRDRPVVEHGRATYRVRDGRITEYWIEAVRR